MSVMDRLLSYMKLNGDEDYDDEYDDDEYDDYEEPETKVSKLTSRKTKSAPVEEEEERPRKASPKITPIKQARRSERVWRSV